MIEHDVFLSLGSNIQREKYIWRCLEILKARYGTIHTSPIFESESVGFKGANFLNLIVQLRTSQSLTELTSELKAIEADLGRAKVAEKFSSRTIDIDVVLFDQLCGEFDGVELPRPELYYNAFVLWPMAELVKDMPDPLSGKSFSQLWSENKGKILETQAIWVTQLNHDAMNQT